jgi:hypothetical protein
MWLIHIKGLDPIMMEKFLTDFFIKLNEDLEKKNIP